MADQCEQQEAEEALSDSSDSEDENGDEAIFKEIALFEQDYC